MNAVTGGLMSCRSGASGHWAGPGPTAADSPLCGACCLLQELCSICTCIPGVSYSALRHRQRRTSGECQQLLMLRPYGCFRGVVAPGPYRCSWPCRCCAPGPCRCGCPKALQLLCPRALQMLRPPGPWRCCAQGPCTCCAPASDPSGEVRTAIPYVLPGQLNCVEY